MRLPLLNNSIGWNQSLCWKFHLVIKGRQLEFHLAHYLEMSIESHLYALGSFHWSRFPYHPPKCPSILAVSSCTPFLNSLPDLIFLFLYPHLQPTHKIYFTLLWRSMSLIPSATPTHSESMDCSLLIFYLTANTHTQANIYHIYLSWSEGYLTQYNVFLVMPFCMKILWWYFYNSWVIHHCLNVLHFLSIFIEGHMGCFYFQTSTNRAEINMGEQVFLW